MRRLTGLFLPLAVALPWGCGDAPEPYRDAKSLLTLREFVAEGHRRALAFAAADDALRGLYAAVSDAVVRVQVQHDAQDPGRVTTHHGSGVLVGGGRYVASAGHVVEAIDRERGATARVVLTDGRVLPAEGVTWRDCLDDGQRRDWALLRLTDPPEGLPSLEFGEAIPGARGMVLGYPSRIGIAASGEGQADHVSAPQPLAPVACVVRIRQTVGRDVRPLAGMTLGDGLSGGPLVDSERRIVGILHRTTTHHESDDSWVTYDCDDTWHLQEALRKALAK